VLSGEKVSPIDIANAMEQCNEVDQQILDAQNGRMSSYLKDREGALYDCDKSAVDDELDAHHQKLREQYQQLYGKDIKHG